VNLGTYQQAFSYPAALTRAEYESACNDLGAEILPDSKCDSYGVHYGVFFPPEYSIETCAAMTLADKRRVGIKNEQREAAKARPPRPVEPMVRCDCGHKCLRSQAMSAALGSSCPDCYDRMDG